ncbi:MAG TPA: VRR-NUC domain-containing protein [candidate division CPR3 bacterium]|uniref:VRR-NUC domain-containing protein n=1 Tax=candidate division CPR3 bacterium TaxID=2268181 RepID=A0A7C1SXD9_UNCC3|nr:VRR-NUC domain-containing protein [candidate division CPR3 bacterium]
MRKNEEGIIQLQIIHYLRMKGCPVGKIKTKGSFTKGKFLKDPTQWTGLPDLLAFVPEMIFLEVKRPKGKQSPNQEDFQELCKKAGQPYYVVHSVAEVEQFLPK